MNYVKELIEVLQQSTARDTIRWGFESKNRYCYECQVASGIQYLVYLEPTFLEIRDCEDTLVYRINHGDAGGGLTALFDEVRLNALRQNAKPVQNIIAELKK